MSTEYTRYFSALSDYNAVNPIDDRDIDGEFDAMVIAFLFNAITKSSAPGSPIAGMLWLDSTNKLLKQYRNSEWVVMGAVHVSSTAPSTMQSGDIWVDQSTTQNTFKVRNKANNAWLNVPLPASEGTSGQFLQSAGAGVIPVWADVVTADATVLNTLKIRGVTFVGTGSNGATAAAKTIGGAHTIVKNTTGDYTITWATAFADANYMISGSAQLSNSSTSVPTVAVKSSASNPATGSVTIKTSNDGSTGLDMGLISVIAIGT
jgi:hypothetical protein